MQALGWGHVGAAAAASGVFVLVAVACFWRCCCKSYKIRGTQRFKLRSRSQSGIELDHGGSVKRVKQQSGFGRGNKGRFRWTDHPLLAIEAVENGWSGFGFTGQVASSPLAIFGVCSAGEVQMGWEICDGCADLMQKIEVKNGNACVVRAALPLPGPAVSFPQEAYFEITVLWCGDEGEGEYKDKVRVKESEWAKLIQQQHGIGKSKVDDVSSKFEASIGLTVGVGGSVPLKLPGTYPFSIAFNSNGSVFLDGIKLVFESEKAEWGRKDQVIGCGFDPRNKKVFFTVDSQMVHVFQCQPEEFGTPLYPTLAANTDITFLVNLGQSAFKYEPANVHRTPNPCFTGPAAASLASAFGYDDSRELFSVGSQWLNRPPTNKPNNTQLAQDFDADSESESESEAELFEIVLDKSPKRTPSVTQSKD